MDRDAMLMLANRCSLYAAVRPGRVHTLDRTRCDPSFHVGVADAYERAESRPWDDSVLMSYRHLAMEVRFQFDTLTSAGLRFVPSADASYPGGSQDVFRAIESGTLLVFDGGEDHPMLSRYENWQFRAVHDCFGHYLMGASFGPNGEESAYRCHRQLFSPAASLALTSETRGQNSWVNFGPHRDLPASDRPFAPQKATILPSWCGLLY